MLPAANRLRGDAQFRQLIKSGAAAHGTFFFLRYARTNEKNTRVAFVVSGKVVKTIVARNKLKRRMREIVRRGLPMLVPGYDILLVAKKGAPNLSFAELNDSLYTIFTKARLIKAA